MISSYTLYLVVSLLTALSNDGVCQQVLIVREADRGPELAMLCFAQDLLDAAEQVPVSDGGKK